MGWYKQYDEREKMWVVYNGEPGCDFAFENEDMADLMLFCLEKAIS
jgi:hypothetical protein